MVYFTANPNGEAEVIRVVLKPGMHIKKLEVLKDLSELAIKSRTARGNVLTKYDVKNITLKQKGHSTLGGRKVWFDPDILRINYDGQGNYLGEFWDGDRILVITQSGDYYTTGFDLTAHFDQNILRIEKYNAEKIWSLAMWNDELGFYYGKRFKFDDSDKPQSMLGEGKESRIVCLNDSEEACFRLIFEDSNREPQDILMSEFIDDKSAKAKGKRFTTLPIASIEDITPEPEPEPELETESESKPEEGNEEPKEVVEEPEEEAAEESKEESKEGIVTTEVSGVKLTITNEIPEDSKPKDEQLSLF